MPKNSGVIRMAYLKKVPTSPFLNAKTIVPEYIVNVLCMNYVSTQEERERVFSIANERDSSKGSRFQARQVLTCSI